MNNKEFVVNYLNNERQKKYYQILRVYKEATGDGNIINSVEYLDSLYRAHLKARIYIDTQKLTGADLQRQINIREDNLERIYYAVSEKTGKMNAEKIVNMYRDLADTDEDIYVIHNSNYFNKLKVINKVNSKISKKEDNLEK